MEEFKEPEFKIAPPKKRSSFLEIQIPRQSWINDYTWRVRFAMRVLTFFLPSLVSLELKD
jgi:hypothetical protein